MADTIAIRLARLRARRAELGQRRRELYLTDDEWSTVNASVRKLRKGAQCASKRVSAAAKQP